MEENAQEATRKATQISTQLSKHSPIKIKILLAYLEKILYLWAEGKVRDYKKTRSWKETSTGHQHCGIPQKKQDTFVGWHPTQ